MIVYLDNRTPMQYYWEMVTTDNLISTAINYIDGTNIWYPMCQFTHVANKSNMAYR